MNLLEQLSTLKRVAIYGYGQEGQSIKRWLSRHYPKIKVDILNDTLLEVRGCEVYSGEAVAAQLLEYELVFKSPGISPYQASIQTALAQGIQFSSSTNLWFASYRPHCCVVISGTKGKSTTSSLVAHMLKAQGREVVLAGNIGHPLLDQKAAPEATWVLELSSYQLWDFNASPDVVALLNLFPEHLDWHGSVECYYQDKLHLLTRPDENTLRISNAEDSRIGQYYPGKVDQYFNDKQGFHVQGHHIYFDEEKIPCLFHLRGEHNLKNLAAAFTIVEQLGIPVQQACLQLDDFKALAHRLNYLGERSGFAYVDDSISTTPQSALAAINSFDNTAITLIVGGYDRGLDWQDLAAALPQSTVKLVVTLPDNGDKIQQTIAEVKDAPLCYAALNMAMALELAKRHSAENSIILLSPGAPSYGHYRNFKERGQLFAQLAGF